MAKLMVFAALLSAACLMAGLYGALHNQISYTVSPEYFHAFKFQQFDIPVQRHDRIGAAIVGWKASWWMGVLIGFPILIAGLNFPDDRTYAVCCLKAFGVVMATALVVGLGALAFSRLMISPDNLSNFWFPQNVADQAAFARAGTMHNFSYLGGFLGILTGSSYLIIERQKLNRPNR